MVIPYKVISYTPGPRWPRSSDTSFKSGSGGCCLVTSWQVWWWCWWRWWPATPWQLPASFSVVVHSAVTHLVCRDPPIHYWSLTPSQRVGAKTGGGVDSILKRRWTKFLWKRGSQSINQSVNVKSLRKGVVCINHGVLYTRSYELCSPDGKQG